MLQRTPRTAPLPLPYGPPDPGFIRSQVGLTQAAMAAALGVTPNTWARWERGTLAIQPATNCCWTSSSSRPSETRIASQRACNRPVVCAQPVVMTPHRLLDTITHIRPSGWTWRALPTLRRAGRRQRFARRPTGGATTNTADPTADAAVLPAAPWRRANTLSLWPCG